MSLAKTAKNFKLGIKIFLVVFFGYYLMILVVIPKTKTTIRRLVPEKDPPNPIFGQIDAPKFIQKQLQNQTPRYVLDTKNDQLPAKLPRKMVVYKVKKPQFSYLAGTEAQNIAKTLGFSDKDLTSDLKSDVMTWKSLLTGGTLEIKKSTGTIKLETNVAGRTGDYRPGNISQSLAALFAKDLLRRINRLDTLYSEGTQSVVEGKFTGKLITQSFNSGETQIAKVDFFRELNKYPILGPDKNTGLLQVYLRNPTLSGSPLNYPILNVNMHSIEPETNATYPIVYVDEAWDQVKNNKGVVASVRSKGSNPFEPDIPTRVETIYISKIYLAYYETPEYTQYLQPIFVFEGTYTTRGTQGGDITLYFPAITSEFIKKP